MQREAVPSGWCSNGKRTVWELAVRSWYNKVTARCRPSVWCCLETPLRLNSHTRYRALGPELIPVYRQSACRWLFVTRGGRLSLLSTRPAVTFPAKERHRTLTGTKLYCLLTGTQVWTTCPRWESNTWPNDRKSNALLCHLIKTEMLCNRLSSAWYLVELLHWYI